MVQMRDYDMVTARAKTGRQKAKAKIPYHKKPEGISNEEWQRELRKSVVTSDDLKKQFTIIYGSGEQAVFGDYSVKNNENGNVYNFELRNPKTLCLM